MVRTLDSGSLEQRRALARLARRYHAEGWMLGTSGNLSARFEGPEGPAFVITASGLDKRELQDEDFVEVALDGSLLATGADRRPSAETSIHRAVYVARPEVVCGLHVHSIASTTLSLARGVGSLHFEKLEMLKGWGFWQPDARVALPVFANHGEVSAIADELSEWLSAPPSDGLEHAPAMLIAGHGMTAWGASIAEAHRHVEITEFLCRFALGRQDSP